MLTLKDAEGFCPLSMEEVRVVALHERLPDIVALEKVVTLLEESYGNAAIHQMLDDEYRRSLANGHLDRASTVLRMLEIFDGCHPSGYDRRRKRR